MAYRFDKKFTRRAVKNIDGYHVFKSLCFITHNTSCLRYCRFRSRLLHKCGSIKRIFDYVIVRDLRMIEVCFCSRRGFVYSCFIDSRGF